jgi:DnaJ-class molecular chaperone
MISCPTCSGDRLINVHLRTSTGGRWETRDCSTCSGVGSITTEHAERIAKGLAMREDRKSRGLSLGEEAVRLGLSRYELSRLENGRENQ